MALEGRGAHYSRARGAMEWLLANAYRGRSLRGRPLIPDAWPAKLAHASGLQAHARVVHHRVVTPPPRGAGSAARSATRSATRPLRVAFASDFHAGPTTHPALFDAVVERLNDAKPDILLLGGDYVLFSSDRIAALASRIASINAPLGKLAVLGNHDLWADDDAIVHTLETQGGVKVMVNERLTLPPPFEHVEICGLDDPWVGKIDASIVPATSTSADTFARDSIRIVLVHAPEAMMFLEDRDFDLAVCGHTHGGHIALPGGIPIVSPGPMSRQYAHGRFGLSRDRTLIVSRGVGASESPFRWNAEPDVLVIDIGPAVCD